MLHVNNKKRAIMDIIRKGLLKMGCVPIFVFFICECLGQPLMKVNLDTESLSAEEVDIILKKGKELFEKAHFEEASKEFLVVAQCSDAPEEDRIKAHYFLMKIYRAYGEDEKIKEQIIEILKLNPNYSLSSREPASLRKIFGETKEKFLKEQGLKEKSTIPSISKEDMAVLEYNLAEVSSQQESFSLKVQGMEKELKKLKFSFYITSLTLLILLAVGIGFR